MSGSWQIEVLTVYDTLKLFFANIIIDYHSVIQATDSISEYPIFCVASSNPRLATISLMIDTWYWVSSSSDSIWREDAQ